MQAKHNSFETIVEIYDREKEGYKKKRPSIHQPPDLFSGRELAAGSFLFHGFYLSLSTSGDVIAIGSLHGTYAVDSVTSASLTVQVYSWKKQSTTWEPLGGSLFFEDHLYSVTIDDFFSSKQKVEGLPLQSVVLAGDSETLTLAVASQFPFAGVQVYKWSVQREDWEKAGRILSGKNVGDAIFGYSLDLSVDGSILAVGSDSQSDNATITIFEWNGANYQQLWNPIPGGQASSVSLSPDGKSVAVGLPFNNGGTTNVYGLTSKCPGSSSLFRVSFTTDENGEENQWDVRSMPSGDMLMEGGPYNYPKFTSFADEMCLDLHEECSVFTIYDENKDGIIAPAGYSIILDGEEQVHGGAFEGFYEQHHFGNCQGCPEGTSLLKLELQARTWDPMDLLWSFDDSAGREILNGTQGGAIVETYCIPTLKDCATFSLANTAEQGTWSWCTTLPGYPRWNYTIFLDGEVVGSSIGDYSCNQRSVVGDCTENAYPTPKPKECDENFLPLRVSVASSRSPSYMQWSVSSCSDKVLLDGGPYRPTDFERVFVKESCVPESDCAIFAINKGDDLAYGSFNVSLGGELVATGDEFGQNSGMGVIRDGVEYIPLGKCATQQGPPKPPPSSPPSVLQMYCN
jgi:hypothetical protein